MRRLLIIMLASALLLGTVMGAQAAPKWNIDLDHCLIHFTVKHIFTQVPVVFREFGGTIRFDPKDLKGSRVDITIKTDSVFSRISRRDRHLRSSDFLDVARYPHITFKSSKIVALGGNRYEAVGRLTIKKVTKQIRLPFVFHGVRVNPLKKSQLVAGITAKYTLDRLAFGVGSGKYYQMGVVGKTVTISIFLELLRDR